MKLNPMLPIANKEYNLMQKKKQDYTYFFCEYLRGVFYEYDEKLNLKETHFVFEFGYNVKRYLYTTKTQLLKEYNNIFITTLEDECENKKEGHPQDKDNQKFLGYK